MFALPTKPPVRSYSRALSVRSAQSIPLHKMVDFWPTPRNRSIISLQPFLRMMHLIFLFDLHGRWVLRYLFEESFSKPPPFRCPEPFFLSGIEWLWLLMTPPPGIEIYCPRITFCLMENFLDVDFVLGGRTLEREYFVCSLLSLRIERMLGPSSFLIFHSPYPTILSIES